MESLHMMESHHLALLIEEIHFSYFYKMVALHHMMAFHNIMGFHCGSPSYYGSPSTGGSTIANTMSTQPTRTYTPIVSKGSGTNSKGGSLKLATTTWRNMFISSCGWRSRS